MTICASISVYAYTQEWKYSDVQWVCLAESHPSHHLTWSPGFQFIIRFQNVDRIKSDQPTADILGVLHATFPVEREHCALYTSEQCYDVGRLLDCGHSVQSTMMGRSQHVGRLLDCGHSVQSTMMGRSQNVGRL